MTIQSQEVSVLTREYNLNYDGVICFSCGDWWYHNRGHFDMQLMRRFSRDVPVLYVNAMGMRLPSVREGTMFATRIVRKLRSVSKGFVKYANNFYVFSPLSIPLYSYSCTRRANAFLVRCQIRVAIRRIGFSHPLLWVVSPPAVDVLNNLQHALLVYQKTDDFKEFDGVDRPAITEMDRALTERSDLVIHVNQMLHEESIARGAHSFLTSHGVDYDRFAAESRDGDEPTDIARIEHPRVGFYGGIDSHTFDVGLLRDVASLLPGLSFVLIGHASADVDSLSALSNIHFLGQKPYEAIPSYGRAFDVAIMPWRQNKWIKACNPVKLKEYLALGKPVVSTPYPEGRSFRDIVYFAASAHQFAEAIQQALHEDCDELREKRKQRVAGQTWDALFFEISSLINDIR